MTYSFEKQREVAEDYGRFDLESRLDPNGEPLSPEGQQLRDIASRIEDFLVAQIRRLESAVQDNPEFVGGSGDVDVLRSDLADDRRRWETERTREVERIKKESTQLIQAWERVETEQRELLAQRGTSRGNVRSSQQLRNADTECALDADTVPYSDQDRMREVVDDQGMSPESAVLQFQQLRREIQRHTQQHR